MATINNFEELEIWKTAIDLAVKTYKLADVEPLKSDFGMKDQIRRSVNSISNNIAEGFEYGNNPDFIRLLTYAKGSTGEFRNQLIILNKVNKLETLYFNELHNDTKLLGIKIGNFIKYLKTYKKKNRNP